MKNILIDLDFKIDLQFVRVIISASNPKVFMLMDRLSLRLFSAVTNKHLGSSGRPMSSFFWNSSTKYGKRHGGIVFPAFVQS